MGVIITDLPELVLRERDPTLSFPTDLNTEAGKQALELWYIFSTKRDFEYFCNTVRTLTFSNVIPTGFIQIPLKDKFYNTIVSNNKFVQVQNRWRINIANFELTGLWTKDLHIKSKTNNHPRRGAEVEMTNKHNIFYRNKK